MITLETSDQRVVEMTATYESNIKEVNQNQNLSNIECEQLKAANGELTTRLQEAEEQLTMAVDQLNEIKSSYEIRIEEIQQKLQVENSELMSKLQYYEEQLTELTTKSMEDICNLKVLNEELSFKLEMGNQNLIEMKQTYQGRINELETRLEQSTANAESQSSEMGALYEAKIREQFEMSEAAMTCKQTDYENLKSLNDELIRKLKDSEIRANEKTQQFDQKIADLETKLGWIFLFVDDFSINNKYL